MAKPKIIAHRGYSQKYPENTLQAFEEAFRVGAEMIETDLQITRDGTILLRHSPLDRSGRPLCELDWEDLRRAEQPVPTLQELLDLLKVYSDAELLLEVKDRRVIEPLANALKLLPHDEKARIVVGSFDALSLAAFKDLVPSVRTSLLFGTVLTVQDMTALALKFCCQFIHPCWESRAYYPHQLLSAEDVEKIQESGLDVVVWHEERPDELRNLLTLPVYGICTNDPLLLKKLRDEETGGSN